METFTAALKVTAVLSVLTLWLAHDKLTWVHELWCWSFIAAAAAGYALSCWWWPFGKCWCCKGKGSHFRSDGKVFRDCRWWCGGSGRKLRWGRRVYNFVHAKMKAS